MKDSSNRFNIKKSIITIISVLLIMLGCVFANLYDYRKVNVGMPNTSQGEDVISNGFDIIPEYSGSIFITLNGDVPYFSDKDYTTEVFEIYSKFDEHGRCGVAYANICEELMPEEGKEREKLDYDPTGWNQSEYNGNYVYHRCHLIARSLAGEENNKLNLITGTNNFNINGMKPFEDRVSEYIKKHPNNHVLYRVTPIYKGNNAVASGVQMEAYSVEDNGIGVHFNVFVYNIQPGVEINYLNGEIIENLSRVLNSKEKQCTIVSLLSLDLYYSSNNTNFQTN